MTAEVRHMKTNAEVALANLFSAVKTALPGEGEVAAARAAAFDSFAAAGLPHRRVETWRYTDLRTLMRDAKPLAPPPDAAAKALARNAGNVLGELSCRRLVMVDGTFAADLSDLAGLENGLTVRSMAEALASGDALVCQYLGKVIAVADPALALNTAFMGDGVLIHVAPGVTVERPIQIVFVTTGDRPAAMFMRSMLVVEAGARVTLIETYEGPARSHYQVNTALELVVGDGARVDRIKMIGEGADAIHIGSLLAHVGARASLNDFSFTTGGAVIRNQLYVRFAGEGTVAGLRGASLLNKQQHADTALFIEHAAGGCESREVFKSVLDGEARSAFQGKITVRPEAQKTDARMMTRALLLSPTAEANSKPELEIFADDVQCGHGSTAGALDDELKFYLMARGIAADEAEALLIQAFIGDVVETIEDEKVKDALIEATVSWLGRRA
ncbi:Fe-S cluster assembly protein SufD [Microbacteriaceae bacterium K1510]|nr:Fe-S cluster assembly protein SufD [Microbacteriaceae bacterium K1510]